MSVKELNEERYGTERIKKSVSYMEQPKPMISVCIAQNDLKKKLHYLLVCFSHCNFLYALILGD